MQITGTTVLDLRSLGGSVTTACSVETYEDPSADPPAVLRLSGLSGEVINSLLQPEGLKSLSGQRVSGTLADGRGFEGHIGVASGLTPTGPAELAIDAILTHFKTKRADGPPANLAGGRWLFRLANIWLPHGDEKTEYPAPGGRPLPMLPFTLNKIRFTIVGREWELTDDLMRSRKVGADPDIRGPLMSGTLVTKHNQGDTWESVSQMADDIACLLSLATSRGVRWVSQTLEDATGQAIEGRTEAVWLPPFRSKGHAHIDQWDFGVIRRFIEECYPRYVQSRNWFQLTLDMYLQAQLNEFISIKASILNTLLDRIQQHVNGKAFPPQIDPKLPGRADRKWLPKVLTFILQLLLSPQWDLDRTAALIGTIKDWNSRPSFPRGVELACTKLQIPVPPKKTINRRHKLIHLGELDLRIDKAAEYWGELDLLVLLLILQLLGYTGTLVHHKIGPEPVSIEQVLKDAVG